MVTDPKDFFVFYASPERDADLLYWSGFRAPDSFLAFESEGKRHAVLSSLEFDRGQREGRFDEVLSLEQVIVDSGTENDIAGRILWLAEKYKASRLALPDDFPARIAFDLEKRSDLPLHLVERPICVERVRKTAEELESIRRANAVIGEAYSAVEEVLGAATIQGDLIYSEGEPLTSEKLRALIGTTCLQKGCLAEGTIVAGGDQACDPHERGRGPLPANSMIIVDIFPREETSGYYGDMTRTYLKGRANDEQRTLYNTVREAQAKALDGIRGGVDGMEIHSMVVDYFEGKGFQTSRDERGYFGFFHGTGHGLGLEIHEEPRVSRQSSVLEEGMVITVEPGLYYRGLGGCRIEDVVCVRQEGVSMLSNHPQNWEIE